jgi:hypothetical protein
VLLAWLLAGLAAVTSNIALDSSQDWSASQVLTDAQDGPGSAGADQPGDAPAILQLAFDLSHPGSAVSAGHETGGAAFSNAPRKGWHGRAPPTA